MWNIHDRWAIFISGRGSNLQALLDLNEAPSVALVVSSTRKAEGLRKAQRRGVPTLVLEKNVDWMILSKKLKDLRVNKIFLLGFMKIIPFEFIKDWDQKIINVHPSLLPKYVGLHALEKSFQSNDSVGVTVHEVTADLDAGPILLQRKVIEEQQCVNIKFDDCVKRVAFTEHQMVRETFLKW
ncbi:MAG TPA: formyltransferase family protein [Pseudobdellovibrionaceae bacterium]|nr:formyltransferase family protein [Pseudobdellovibrionaceae bacterium]